MLQIEILAARMKEQSYLMLGYDILKISSSEQGFTCPFLPLKTIPMSPKNYVSGLKKFHVWFLMSRKILIFQRSKSLVLHILLSCCQSTLSVKLIPILSFCCSALDKLKVMEETLTKAKQIQDDCDVMVKKLRAMLHSSEEQVRVHKKQALFLTQLTAKTLPKGLHCLPLRLTTEYYTLNSSQQDFPGQEKLKDPLLFHYALFSDNVLATAAVVNSTVSNAKVSLKAWNVVTIS